MSSVWIEKRKVKTGVRYRVQYRDGGRGAPIFYMGSFLTRLEAEERKAWVKRELAAMRSPNIWALQ